MTRIWKFVIADVGKTSVQIPAGAKTLSAGAATSRAGGTPLCVYAEVDPTSPPELRTFSVVRESRDLLPGDAESRQYVGTVFDEYTSWHIYELRQPSKDRKTRHAKKV